METLANDIKYALRSLKNSPVFTGVALMSLALGIGANTAIFSIMDQVVLRLLPVQKPEELVIVKQPGPHAGFVLNPQGFSYPAYRDLRDRNNVFGGVLGYYRTPLNMAWHGQTERISGVLVSGNYLEVLGLKPAIGRNLMAEDDLVPGGEHVAMLTYGYWKRRFGGDRSILNQSIHLNGQAMTVVGVTQPGFEGLEVGSPDDVLVPLMMKAQMTPGWDDLENRRTWFLTVVARLKPGVSRQQAEAGVNATMQPILAMEAGLIPEAPARVLEQYRRKHIAVAPGSKGESDLRRQFSAPLIVLMSMVGLVLLIACANVANLLTARAAGRQKEIAIRLALGASRRQIMRQLLCESTVLAIAGGGLGILVSSWAGSILLRFLPFENIARSLSADPDGTVLLFALALSLATGLLFGLIPALQATRPVVAGTLKEQAANVSAGSAHVRFRKALVVAQIALSLLLLIAAALFARSLYNLKSVDPGFRPERLMTFGVDASLNGYSKARRLDIYQRLLANIGALPGVRAVSLASFPVVADSDVQMTIKGDGEPSKDGADTNPNVNWVGPGYFSTLGIPLLAGREFSAADTAGGHKTAVINEKMARAYFGDANPIGRHIGIGTGPRVKMDIEIVGVVKNSNYNSVRESPPGQAFFPYTQSLNPTHQTFYVRTAQDPGTLARVLRREVQAVDPALPATDMKTMEAQMDESIFIDRMIAFLAASFGFLATLLAALGLYGVMAYMVARRTREIGIRIALGAKRADVLNLVMKEVSLLALTGVAIALPLAFPISRLLQSQLFGIAPADPATLAAATITMAVVALIAGYLPAWRAARVDPLIALRYE